MEGVSNPGHAGFFTDWDSGKNHIAAGGKPHRDLCHIHLSYRLHSDQTGTLRESASGTGGRRVFCGSITSVPDCDIQWAERSFHTRSGAKISKTSFREGTNSLLWKRKWDMCCVHGAARCCWPDASYSQSEPITRW